VASRDLTRDERLKLSELVRAQRRGSFGRWVGCYRARGRAQPSSLQPQSHVAALSAQLQDWVLEGADLLLGNPGLRFLPVTFLVRHPGQASDDGHREP
jgi:hypothetical protein